MIFGPISLSILFIFSLIVLGFIFLFNNTITGFQDISLENISIIIPILALVYTIYKDKQLRKKEYADRIRKSSGIIIAELERWKELSLRFFDDIQPLITEIDVSLKDNNSGDKVDNNKANNDESYNNKVIDARDTLWIKLNEKRAEASRRITDEKIEIAYADLYGYNEDIHKLYTNAIKRIKLLDLKLNKNFLKLSQEKVLILSERKKPFKSAQLGNQLRGLCGIYIQLYDHKMDNIINPFRTEMTKLINASDDQIVNKDIAISDLSVVFGKIDEEMRDIVE